MTYRHIKIFLVVLFITGLLFVYGKDSNALEIGLQDTDVSIDMVPENPEPYQDVTVNLTSYATDLNKSMIEWRSGSNLILSGLGRTSYSFTTLGPNVSTIFDITIRPAEGGGAISKRIVINPSEVEILWEGVDSYTPPFYRGKSFISREGRIKAVAIPNTTRVGKGGVTYTWKSGDSTVLGASGYNKDAYVFTNSELNLKENLTVSASSVDGRYNATKTITIPTVSPQIVFYKKSPTEGISYNNALTNDAFIDEEEVTIVAVPYFSALRGNENAFSYTWKVNGETIETPSKKTELTLRPASRGGYATVNLELDNLSTFFQRVSGQLKLSL